MEKQAPFDSNLEMKERLNSKDVVGHGDLGEDSVKKIRFVVLHLRDLHSLVQMFVLTSSQTPLDITP